MKGNAIINSPSLKPQIFAINGQYNKVINSTAVYFGNSAYIIIPVNCEIFKLFSCNVTVLKNNLLLQVEIYTLQQQNLQFFTYVGNKNNYQVFNVNQTANEGNLLYLFLKKPKRILT